MTESQEARLKVAFMDALAPAMETDVACELDTLWPENIIAYLADSALNTLKAIEEASDCAATEMRTQCESEIEAAREHAAKKKK